jgi:transposase-like protein
MAARHVDGLSGSRLAKKRLEAILKTLRGEWTIARACQELEICESRFHALRRDWLQQSLELLEPRPAGRPAKSQEIDLQEVQRLDSQLKTLEQELVASQVRREAAEISALGGTALPLPQKVRRLRAR